MRTFIALEVPDGFRRETAELARLMEGRIEGRFLPRETYHVTLAFLGETDGAQRRLAMDAVDAACASMPPVQLAPDGLGKFGKASDATLWLGLERDEALMGLASRLRGELDARGIPFDPKPFRPHITIARRARIPKGELPALPFPQPAEARAVTLFKSELSREGAAYKPLHSAAI